MKSPFEKNDNKVLITGIAIGSIAAGAAAYLFLTDTGHSVRKQISKYATRIKEKFMPGDEKPTVEAATAYLHHKMKKPKTDRDALIKHEILHTEHAQPDGE